MLIAVCSERSSCPCFVAALAGKPVSRSDDSWCCQGSFFRRKEKYRPRSTGEGFCRGETAAKWIGCVAGRYVLSGQSSAESGGYHGENRPLPVAVFKMNTTTSCRWIWTNPQERWDLQEKYHGMWNSSRGFWEIYGNKVERVGLLNWD